MNNGSYRTVDRIYESCYRELSSKFIAQLRYFDDPTLLKELISDLRKSNPKSRHICFAYRLVDGAFRHSDDGEPGGTAGLPIYNQILSANLHNVIVTCVRYFGGTKLGVPGLINAYKTSAKDCINTADIIEIYPEVYWKIVISYEIVGKMVDIINSIGIKIVGEKYENEVIFNLSSKEIFYDQDVLLLKSKMLNINPTDYLPSMDILLHGIRFM